MKNVFASLLALVVLVSCSGGNTGGSPHVVGSGRPSPAITPAATATATATAGTNAKVISGTLSLTIPPRLASSNGRHRAFLSPSAVSVSIAVTGEPNVIADISASSPACTTPSPSPISSGGASPAPTTRSCTVTVLAPVGTDTFTATLYDAQNATGAVLGTGTATQTVLADTPFMVQIGVQGQIGSIVVSVVPSYFTVGNPATATVTVTAYDADDNQITGTYAAPITLTDSDTTGTFALSTTSIANSTTPVNLTYSGAAQPQSATISATSSGVAVKRITPQTVFAADMLLYTVNSNATITETPSIVSGNAAPERVISGSNTAFQGLYGIAVDSTGITYVSNFESQEESTTSVIEAFAAGANGNVAPLRTINVGSNISALAADSNNDVYAATPYATAIEVYGPTADGSATPLRSVTSSAMGGPVGVALDSKNLLYVADNFQYDENGDAIFVFPANADGQTTPVRQIYGADTGLGGPVDLTVDASGNIYVANAYSDTVTVYGPTANGDAAPIRTISGGLTTLTNPYGVAVDAAGYLYVADANTSSIVVFAPGASGNVAPVRTISGAATGLSSPYQMILAPP